MSLSNAQYDRIMADYERERRARKDALDARTAEVYARIPRFRELDRMVPELGLKAETERLNGTRGDLTSFRAEMTRIMAEKQTLLAENGFPADYLDMTYACPDCGDTGYVDGRRCACFKKRTRELLYRQSNLAALFSENNFDRMDTSFYQGDDLRRFLSAKDACGRFIEGFHTEHGYANLLFFGPVGSGKSFLSIATAKEILDLGFSALYFSATDLFSRLSDAAFDADKRALSQALRADLESCDLLLIDDLGTELTNAFISSQLFHIINERHLRRHATIISTNFDFEELRGRYSDRVFSRLLSAYTVCELTGGDVRLMKSSA